MASKSVKFQKFTLYLKRQSHSCMLAISNQLFITICQRQRYEIFMFYQTTIRYPLDAGTGCLIIWGLTIWHNFFYYYEHYDFQLLFLFRYAPHSGLDLVHYFIRACVA